MQQTLNFNSRQIISREEMRSWDYSLRVMLSKVLKYLGSNNSRGILDQYTSLGYLENGFFTTAVGSIPSGGYDTIHISEGWGLFDVSGLTSNIIPSLLIDNDSLTESGIALFHWLDTDNIDANIGLYSPGAIVNVGFAPVFNPMEDGICAISASNQVTISGGNFNKLRDQSFKNPTLVRFYNADGSVANNSQVYEVIQKISDTQIVISGVTVLEPNVKMVVVGAYDLGVYGNLSNKMAYPTINGRLVFTTNEEDILNAGGFIVSELHIGSGGSFTITDVRESNVFNFALPPDVMLKSVSQTVTGSKTFIESPIKLGVPTVEIVESDSLVSPLLITFDADPTNKVLTIPMGKTGSIYTVKATLGSGILGRLVMEDGYQAGTKIYLMVDPNSDQDLVFNYLPTVPGSVRIQNLDYAGLWSGFYSFIVKKGCVLELLALPNLQWVILNSNPLITV